MLRNAKAISLLTYAVMHTSEIHLKRAVHGMSPCTDVDATG